MASSASRTPRKRAVRARGERTVAMLLDATERVLVADGLAGVTMKRVAAQAGMSVATAYQYFPTRDALVAAWEERFWDSLLDRLARFAGSASIVGGPLCDAIYTARY